MGIVHLSLIIFIVVVVVVVVVVTGKQLAQELLDVQRRNAEEGGKAVAVREETVEEFEEEKIRTEAESYLERGLANTFQEAVALAMYNRQVPCRCLPGVCHSTLTCRSRILGVFHSGA